MMPAPTCVGATHDRLTVVSSVPVAANAVTGPGARNVVCAVVVAAVELCVSVELATTENV